MRSQGRYSYGLFTAVCAITLWASQPSTALVISEIMYHPADGTEALEFVELYNDRAVIEDLSGYAFVGGISYVFEQGVTIPAKGRLVLARDPAAMEAVYGISGVHGPFSGRLDNGGERIQLAEANGQVIISLRYDDERPWPISPDGTGHSLILAKLGGDPDEASTWAPSVFTGGTPGAPDEIEDEPEDPVDPTLVTLVDVGHPGRYFKGTKEPSPGAGGIPTTDWTQIAFNDNPATTDWIDGPSGYGYSSDPSEMLVVRTPLNDMLGNYISVYARLRFDLTAQQIASFSQVFAEVHYDDDFVLYLNGVRVGASDGLVGDPPPFDAGRGGGSDPPAASVDLTDKMKLLVSGTNVLAIQGHNATIAGSSDCIASPILRAVMAEEPPPPPTVDEPTSRIVVNEILANSDAGAGVDWIELYNPGPVAVDLSNVYLSDDEEDLLQFKLPDGVVLQPGEFWVVGQGTAPDGFEFGLDSGGESVFVTAATSEPPITAIRVLDAVRYDAMPPEATWGRYPDGSNRFEFLSSATFTQPNAQPFVDDIVINEIMYHHGTRNELYEYVELHNKGSQTVALGGWAFTDGIDYEFAPGVTIAPGSYLVVAKDPNILEIVYSNLVKGANLFGPYVGGLDDHSERIRLSYPIQEVDPDSGQTETHMVTADEVTYYDGGRWPSWADGQGASLELRDPRGNNDTPDAWADSDESSKTTWQQFSFTINGSDSRYSHSSVNVIGMMLLNRGELLLDDLEVIINGTNVLSNNGFEDVPPQPVVWRMLGNHVRSFVTTEDRHSGSRCLHMIATGHGDPGANRVNQSIGSINAGTVTFRGWARWLRGAEHLLMRATRTQSPVQPPRPAHSFELSAPVNLGTPGEQNSMFTANRGPEITETQHAPVLPASGEPIIVTARVADNDGIGSVTLNYRSEGSGGFTAVPMVDSGTGDDALAGDGLYTARIPGAASRTMRAFYITATDSLTASTRFPTRLQPSADVPERTCLVRVGDALLNTQFATYRIWMSNDVINTFGSRPNLSNELMDCTFVYDDREVFYNTRIRFRGSPFLRSGSRRNPTDRYAWRIDFNPDQRFRSREEINLDNTEGGNRGPLQERASYWFYRQMGLQYSSQEFVRPILNGQAHNRYEDVQKIDGDYVQGWFPDDADGYIHKIDDYFEYSADGTGFSNLDEGLISDASHPRLKETYRWGFEKRSHRENDEWDHLLDFAEAMNTPSSSPQYEHVIESVIHPEHFARVLALRHAVGDWDSYGFDRGKNNYFYYALPEGRWYLLPWDIDFTLGSGRGPSESLFSIAGGEFPEVQQFWSHPKYRRMYLQAYAELVYGPWQTSYQTNNPPTPFDIFLDDAANALIADGAGDGRRNGIKAYVRDRRAYIMSQIPAGVFIIVTNNGEPFCTADSFVTLLGVAPLAVGQISVNGQILPSDFTSSNVFTVDVPVEIGLNVLNLQGLTGTGTPVENATDSIMVTRIAPCSIVSVLPSTVCNDASAQLTILGGGFDPDSTPVVSLTRPSSEMGFDAMYVQSSQSFDQIDAATLLLDNPDAGTADPLNVVHEWINLYNPSGDHGEFSDHEMPFPPPFNRGADNFAVRITGFIVVPSPGVRYFGVNSDDGFSLRIDGLLVGEYSDPRAPATTDVTQNRTAGTMSFDFPAAGSYSVVLDYFENGGGEEIEFFQTDESGGNRRLINVDAELTVFRGDVGQIDTTNVTVVDEDTITCQVNLAGALPGLWRVTVTPECGQAAQCNLTDALYIVEPPAGPLQWTVTPVDPVGSVGPPGGAFTPKEHKFILSNTGSVGLDWSVAKGLPVTWLDLPSPSAGTLAAGQSTPVTVTLNAGAAELTSGAYTCPLIFSVGCTPTGPVDTQRNVQLTVAHQADFNGDLQVDFLDWALLTSNWCSLCVEPDYCSGTDVDRSGNVDIADAALFAHQWLGGIIAP